MPNTRIGSQQINDDSVTRADLNVDGILNGAAAVTGLAVIRKAVQGTGISLSSTGFDAGTGDVTINLGSWYTSETAQTLLGRYAGTNGQVQEITLGTGLSLNTSTGVLTSSGGATPTWQQVLTAGSTLTSANTITQGANSLTFSANDGTAIGKIVNAGNGTYLQSTSVANSNIFTSVFSGYIDIILSAWSAFGGAAGPGVGGQFVLRSSNGQLEANAYGSGNITGTATYALGVTSSGVIVETSLTGGGGSGTAYAETPSGTINGSNTTFTLAHTPVSTLGVIILLDGSVQYNGIDYTVSGSSITFTTAPVTGSSIFAYYNTLTGAGSGTVTAIGVTTANGVSGTSSGGATPNLTITLGAITPSSVAATGAVTGSNLSGTNTGDQTSIVGITGTTAQFNTALTDNDFATLAGSETLTNKTLTSPILNTPRLGTTSTLNYVWTATDTAGNGSWQAATGGTGITRSINNISGTTTGGATANTDYVYICTGTFTYTQPTAVGNTSRYTIKNSGAGTITVATTSSQTIDGTTTISITAGNSVDLISNNSNWVII